ncbi:unnamed protein product [Tuber aestivum]|uniref:Uncharacterized protein n=1 Tax=Tuber aestivum TaxID=59557 RepID=A0A292Q1V3_9PEZI|nr:unnamed protein product [Tuber aestivum]
MIAPTPLSHLRLLSAEQLWRLFQRELGRAVFPVVVRST